MNGVKAQRRKGVKVLRLIIQPDFKPLIRFVVEPFG